MTTVTVQVLEEFLGLHGGEEPEVHIYSLPPARRLVTITNLRKLNSVHFDQILVSKNNRISIASYTRTKMLIPGTPEYNVVKEWFDLYMAQRALEQ